MRQIKSVVLLISIEVASAITASAASGVVTQVCGTDNDSPVGPAIILGRSIADLSGNTPVSSPFGPRIHPVFKVPEFHPGVDLAAPLGTPIHVLTAGGVEEARIKGSYGLFVRIRHSDICETAYTHLLAFANGIRAGVMLQPGDVLGLVGVTGLSSGPHLHYEIRFNGIAVDPMYPPPTTRKPAAERRPMSPKTSAKLRPKKSANRTKKTQKEGL